MLRRGQVVVEHDRVRVETLAQRRDLLGLAATDEGGGVGRVAPLHDTADDIGARAVDQARQLVELLGHHLLGQAREDHPHQNDPLPEGALNERPRQHVAQESIPGWMSTSATLRTGPARYVVAPVVGPERHLEESRPDCARAPCRPRVRRPNSRAAAAAATLPVPQARVSPAPRSHTRKSRSSPRSSRPGVIHSTLMPPLEGGLELGPELGDVDGSGVGAQQHQVRVPDVDGAGPAVVELLGLIRAEPGRAHVDAGLRPTGRPARRVLDGAGAAGRGHREAGRGHEAGVDGRLGQATDAVAAHLGLAPVGVVQLHGQVGAVTTGPDPDDAVGPDAAVPIGQQAHLGHREPDGVVGVQHDQEVVARPLVLGRLHQTILAAGGLQPCTARASCSRAWASSLLPAQRTRGSRRNHEAWRRANWRVCRFASSTHVGQRGAVLHVGQDLAVAERLARRARHAGGAGGQRPHLVHQAVLDHAVEAGVDPGVDLLGRHGQADLRHAALRIRLEPGAERREGTARSEGDLEGPDDPAAVGRLHPRRTHRVEGGEAGVQVGRPGPALVQLRLQRGGHVGVAARDGEVVDNGAQVEPGAPDQQRMMPAPRDALQRRPRRLLELGHGEILVRVDQVEEVVRHRGLRLGTGLRRPDVHAAVDAHGIDGDDLAVAPAQRQLQGGLRFPRGGDADECDRSQALATGMRTRCRGRATTSSRRPER